MSQTSLAALVAAALAAAHSEAQEAPRVMPEYVVKAGFLDNFAKYVEWPAEFEKDEPISIGVVGSGPFGPDLEGALANQTVNRRAFTVRRFRTPQDLEPCRILFVRDRSVRASVRSCRRPGPGARSPSVKKRDSRRREGSSTSSSTTILRGWKSTRERPIGPVSPSTPSC